jgi:amino acid adenylation domain-containing protein
MTLSIGGCLIMGNVSEMLTDLSSFIESTQTSYAQLTPSVIQLLDPERLDSNASLRILASSGEAMTEGIVRIWADRVQLFNCYGPTETDVVTAHRMTAETSPSCIGRETAGCKVTIRDDQGTALPREIIGEICVSGIQVMNGYLNASDETHWHSQSPEGRIYRTGDRGKIDSGGDVFCLGRKDHEVKVRGNRVNLAEIEETIRYLPDVRSTAVVFPNAGFLQGQLCCFLQADLEEQNSDKGTVLLLELNTSEEAIRMTEVVLEELRQLLPTPAVPTSWWLIRRLPLTSSGKVDRRALLQWLESSADSELQLRTHPAGFTSSSKCVDTDESSPEEAERTIRLIWSELLGVHSSKLSTNRSFFASGGHSLLAVRLVAAMRAQGVDFTMQTLHKTDTIRKQAIFLTRSEKWPEPTSRREAEVPYALIDPEIDRYTLKEAVSKVCSVPQKVIDNIYPCTPMQCGLMVASLQRPGMYICDMSLSTRDRLNRSAFDVAWSQLVNLEPILRTRIALTPEYGMFQVVLAPECAVDSIETHPHDMGIGSRLWQYVFEESVVHFRIHHSILDGAQIPLILDKLGTLYDMAVPSNETLPSQAGLDSMRGTPFTHFLHLISRAASSSDSRNFWLKTMKDQSPTDYPTVTSAVPKYSTSSKVSSTTQWNYRELAAKSNVPPGAFLAALWSFVYSGFADAATVVYGIVHSGRDAAVDGIEKIVAPTIAITPFIAAIDAEITFAHLAATHQKALSDMVPYRHFGLQRIQALGSSYRTACDFRALLVIESEIDHPMAEGPFVLEGVSEARYDYPLVLSLTMKANQVVAFELRYEETFISGEEVQCILSRLKDVSQQLEDSGVQQNLKSLQTPSQAHLEHIVESTTAPFAKKMRVQDIFHNAALKTPEEPAMFDQELGVSLTYSEVERLSGLLARVIVKCGAEPGSNVPLCIENSAYALLGILAVHQAGCAYVPIDLEHPAKRHDFVIEQVNANILLCTSRASANYTHFGGQIINVDEIIPITSGQSEGSTASAWDMVEERSHVNTTNLEEEQAQVSLPGDSINRPSDTAFVLFTSGSTGQPKGVELTHQNIATAVHYLANSFQLEQGIRIFQFSSLTFDMSLLEIYGAWARCGCVCIPSKHSRMNRTSESLREMQVEAVFATPTVASLFRVEDALHLRIMVIGGERLSRGILDRWSARLRLYQIYGPTECGISVASKRVLPDCVEAHNLGPAINARIWILDEDRKPVPSGYPGEIAISGPTVARGYLNDPEKTKNAFITVMPSGKKESEQRVYLTGDIGRRTKDGVIRIYGRKDHQVKIRGIRTELGEIEDSILGAASEVGSVAVGYISNRLVAFLNDGMVATDDEQSIFDKMTSNREAMVHKIRTHLKARLPTRMTPSRFLFTTRWPKTSSGKTDRKALTAAYQTEDFGSSSFSKGNPGSPRITSDDFPERKESKSFSRFRRILQRVLGLAHISRIDPLDTFFEIGGDSFAAMKFVAAAHEDNLEISVQDIYHNPSLSAMHDLMFEKGSEATEDVRRASSDVQRFSLKDFVDPQEIENLTGLALDLLEDIYPCTPFQEGLAALASSHEDLYVTRHVFAITPCDQARFTAALALVIKRTAILRTTIMFSKTLGTLQVVIGPECPSSPPIRFHASVTDLTSQPVQLQEKYLCNFDLVGRDGVVNVFSVTMSHAAFDGWSQELLLDDISKAYCERGLPSPLATFSQFISFQHQRSKDPRNKEFWSDYLSNAQASSWPHEPLNGHMLVCANQRYSTTAKVAWPSRLEQRPAILSGAWALLLAKYENTSNPCFATIFSGRTSDFPNIESVRGPTLSAAVTHVSLKKGETVAGFLKRQQEEFVAMLPHSAHGLQNIKTVSEDAANACELRTMLVIQFAEIQRPESTRQIKFDLIHETMLRGYAVTLACVPTKEGIKLEISYDAAWIHDEQVERLAGQYLHVVEQISTRVHDQSTLNDIDMVPPQDLEQIQRWNLAELKPQKQNVYELVQAAMRKYPHSPAIEGSGGQIISYRDLELHVCAVADTLKKNGIKARDRVLIRMAKSVHQIVALLAIVRVGATFVPIDDEWPHGRISRIAEDAAAAFAIVDEGKTLFETPSSLQEIAVDVLPSTPPVQACSHDPTNSVQPEDLAYILFTSGSTGEPKGILTPHIAVCTTLQAHHDHMDLNSDSRVFHFASLTFDRSITDIFGTLSIGGCICVPNEHERAFELERTILERRANLLCLTPSVAGLLNPENLPTVKTLVLGGESVPQSLTDTWVDKVHLIYAYGPTETTVTTTACHNSRDSHCIGSAIGTTSTWIVDPSNHTRLTPIGTVGELLCIGPSVANGYLNNTVGTAKAFVEPPPWVDRQSKVWKAYRTGDLVRYNADSSIRFLGRADGQLKIRGKRVELTEIDAAIKRTGLVDQVATDVTRRNGTPLLVSFITIVSSDDPDASARDTVVLRSSPARGQVIRNIRSSIQQILPMYMQPWAVIMVNKIPYSSSGKVDRRMLRRIAETLSPEDEGTTCKAVEASDAKYMSTSELTMQGLWSEVLGMERQRIDPNGKCISYISIASIACEAYRGRYFRKTRRRLS